MSIDFPKAEEVVLQQWREINAFHRQVGCFPVLFLAIVDSDVAVIGGTLQRPAALHLLRWPSFCDRTASLWTSLGLNH